ncbi:MAG: hypothetical protein J6A59_03805 [Lachnospiraceae bacterium]|nr:hypothetical protein [Lachnospiraceae bacterium]
MLEWISALSPVISAIIGVLTYSALTNYRLDNLDKQVMEISRLREDVAKLDKRVSILEVKNNE